MSGGSPASGGSAGMPRALWREGSPRFAGERRFPPASGGGVSPRPERRIGGGLSPWYPPDQNPPAATAPLPRRRVHLTIS